MGVLIRQNFPDVRFEKRTKDVLVTNTKHHYNFAIQNHVVCGHKLFWIIKVYERERKRPRLGGRPDPREFPERVPRGARRPRMPPSPVEGKC